MAGNSIGALKRLAARHAMPLAALLLVLADTKWCSGCKEWHSRTAFGPDLTRSDGLASYCKQTHSASRPRPIPINQRRAHRLIQARVGRGTIPNPNALRCTNCHHIGQDRRHEYHHPEGYETKQAREVVTERCIVGRETGISWCDHTFNTHWGCTEVSPGCDNCYARVFSQRPIHDLRNGKIGSLDIWGPGKPRREFGDRHWNEPLAWNRMAERYGVRRRVFCDSMADIMDDEAPAGVRERLYSLADQTPYLIWLFLTKRPMRYSRYLPARFRHDNVQLGFTAEDQHYYDVRFEHTRIAAEARGISVVWVSYEPALGPLTVARRREKPQWIIFGAESGKNRRPCDPDWARASRDECREFGIAFYMKQMGGSTPTEGIAAIPEDLHIQEFPA